MAGNWIQATCLFCGAADGERFLAVPHPDAPGGVSHLVRCTACGLRRLDPRPTQASLGRYYGSAYNAFVGRTRSPRKQAVWDCLRDISSSAPGRGRHLAPARLFCRPLARWAFDINVSLEGNHRRRVLEVGCGYGDLLIYLQSRGCEVQGVDLDPRAAERGKQYGVPIHAGTLDELELPEASFDVAILCHSLEHLPDPRRDLTEVARVLKPGGHLHVAVPNGNAVGLRLEGIAWPHLSHPLHFWYFDQATLARLARETGFEPAQAHSTSRLHYLGTWRQRLRTEGFYSATRALARFTWHSCLTAGGGDVLRMIAVRR